MRYQILAVLLMLSIVPAQAYAADVYPTVSVDEYSRAVHELVKLREVNRRLEANQMPLFFRMFKCFLRKHDWSDPSLGPVFCQRCGVSAAYWIAQKIKANRPYPEQFGGGGSDLAGGYDGGGSTPGPDKDCGKGKGKGHGKGRGKGHDKH